VYDEGTLKGAKQMGWTIVVGDIHGCYEELLELLNRAAFAADDRVVAVGDLIVKGEKNRQVLDLFSSDPRFSSVTGNHDLALRRHWRNEPVSLTEQQESAALELDEERARYSQYLDSLPLMIDLGAHLVVHAGLRPGVALEEQSIEDLTELRTLGPDPKSREGVPWYEEYEGEKTVLFGHWPAREPRRSRRAIGLDTGCVYGHRLTAYIIETAELITVESRRVYDEPRHGIP
jgi:diadenosine tetraphosphatase ApaH/serine/threonine PP2A family protein phosphatase